MGDFQYSPFVNPYASSIADEIARSADASARAASAVGHANAQAQLIKGQGWGRAIENIGQLPAQIAQTQNAETDRKLREQELAMTIEQRQVAQAQRVATVTGRMAGVSTSPEVFADRVSQGMKAGLLPAEIGTHVLEQLRSVGPDGWPALQKSYVDFAEQFEAPIKVGKDEVLMRPTSGHIVGRGPQSPISGTQGTQFFNPPDPNNPGAPMQPIGEVPKTDVVNGQPVSITSTGTKPLGPAIPKQETASEQAEREAGALVNRRRAAEIDAKLAGTIPMSAEEKAKLEIERAHLKLEEARNDRIEKKEDVDNPRYQGTLEKQYRDLAAKVISSRNGVLGIEDGKVTQAKHLIGMMEQFKDKDGNYQIPVAQQMEMAMGLAALIAPRGVPTQNQVEELRQRTAKGDIAGMLTYITGSAVSGSTQGIAKMLRESIERQGNIAEANREKELDAIRAFKPTDLDDGRATGIENGLGGLNSMNDLAGGSSRKVGDPVTYQGKQYRILSIENGNAKLEEVR